MYAFTSEDFTASVKKRLKDDKKAKEFLKRLSFFY